MQLSKYKLVVAYDGTDYAGWQVQADQPSIAQTLQDSFTHSFHKSITILGASRTDAGVHALGQVAFFKTNLALDVQTMQWAWNNALPKDILIRSLCHAPEGFHPYYNVRRKTYYYHIFTQRPLPFVQRYGWHCARPIDEQILNKALQCFVGTHDFRSFCTGNDSKDGTVRTIDNITVTYIKRYHAYRIAITGPRFLRYIIRRLVDAAVAVATRDDLSTQIVQDVLAACDPHHALSKAPAQGLLLRRICYTEK